MRWQKYLVATAVILGVLVGASTVFLYSSEGGISQNLEHPPIVDCSYDAETETATLVVQEERYVDEEFEEVWVLVDGQPATIRRGDRRGEVNETDPDTTTGLWVHDGNITDVADYPVGPGESVTVFDVAPDSHVRIVLVAERTGGADLGFDAEPISENCVLDSQRAGLSSPN